MDAPSSAADKVETSETRMVSEAASLSPDRSDSSISTNLQAQASLKTEEYRQLFRLPPEEILVQDFNCAIQESILIQGHLYMFMRYICFYSNIFGFETKRIIPLHDITCVRKAKTAGIFPNAIEVLASGKKYFFTSFLSRDEAFNLINDGLVDLDNIDKPEVESDSVFQDKEDPGKDRDCGGTENSNFTGFPINGFDSFERFKHHSSSNTALPPKNEDAITMQAPADIQDSCKGDTMTFPRSDTSFTSSTKILWNPENSDSPKISESYVKVAMSNFPIMVEEFFRLFFSDEAVDFLESFHGKCGDKDFSCGLWYPHDLFGHTRRMSFRHPIKIYFGAKFGSCEEVQKFRVYKNSHLVIETSQEVRDAPYGDYFSVQGMWDVQEDGGESNRSCTLNVYINVAFSKKTFWKGKIEQASMEECREAYATWINIAHGLLKQRNLEKQKGSELGDGNPVKESGDGEEAEHSVVGCHGKPPPHVGDEDIVSAVSLYENLLTWHCGFFRGLVNKATSQVKMSKQVLLLIIVVFAATVLLAQISIVVMMRGLPHHQVHIIREANSVKEAGDGVEWLQRQIQHLKDEMVMAETRLERMREDHLWLRAQLENLGRVHLI